MVATLDGKILTGERDEPVHDLGSKTDHAIMQRLERQCDAVIVGANSLRASPGWNFYSPLRITVTVSGRLDFSQPFFRTGPSIVVSPSRPHDLPQGIEWIRSAGESVDLKGLLHVLRTERGIEKLMVLGGSELNAQFFHLDAIDELFLTLAPKVKLGRDVPTYADGTPLRREELLGFRLSEAHPVEDELFLRYIRRRD